MITTPIKKNLIICPHCEAGGTVSILGQIDPDGVFVVMRFHKGETRVMSREFVVQCQCGEVVYQRGSYGTVNLW